jgi:hypothetical protein
MDIIYNIIAFIIFFGIAGILLWNLLVVPFKKEIEEKRKEKENREKEPIRQKEREQRENNNLKIKFNKVDQLQVQLSEIQKLQVVEISDFKKNIIDNEKAIVEKGGDNQLFSFLKLDSFLKDFRERTINDQIGLNEVIDINWLKSRIKEATKRTDIEKLHENLQDTVARLEGRKTTGFDANIDKLFDLGNRMKPVLENQIKTMEYYKNMASAMLVFYLNDKKIRYFEIYEAFEKLGVFDSTWQKNVLGKLDSIEIRLAQISNELTNLNQNFISLVESSENVVSELKVINSSITTNNLLQAITAFQTWRVNKNTKGVTN